MIVCFSCGRELPDRATYCPSCAVQVRCKNKECRDVLEMGARACVSCGTISSDGASVSTTDLTPLPSLAVNVLTFDETIKSRSLRAHLTDIAVNSLGNALTQFISNRLDNRSRSASQALQQHNQPPAGQLRLPFNAAEEPPYQETIASESRLFIEGQTTTPSGTDHERVMRFFRRAGDQLHLDDPRLKAESKLDYARRLTYLFLYAHYLEGRDRVLHTDLYKSLSDARVDDTNTRTWIRKNSSLVKTDESIGLNGAGRDEAKKALNEALDPDRQSEWRPGAERARSSKASTPNGSESKRSTKSSRDRVMQPDLTSEWVTKWKAFKPPIDAHSILKTRAVVDKGIFALWAIRQVAGDAGKIVSGPRLATFILEAFEFKIHVRSLQKAFESKAADGKVLKLNGGYQVQPPGSSYAEQMAGSNQGTAAGKASSASASKR